MTEEEAEEVLGVDSVRHYWRPAHAVAVWIFSFEQIIQYVLPRVLAGGAFGVDKFTACGSVGVTWVDVFTRVCSVCVCARYPVEVSDLGSPSHTTNVQKCFIRMKREGWLFVFLYC
jgi:hypothetical protein